VCQRLCGARFKSSRKPYVQTSDCPWSSIPDFEIRGTRSGSGLGASHQTGWNGLVAKLIELYGFLDSRRVLEVGRSSPFTEKARAAG
jgi:hypothetical protein